VLTGEAPDGLCQLENGAPLSAAAARRIGCDAEIIPVLERDGLPIDVGRKYRSAPQRLRRALEIRDRFCLFPGCGVPARQTHAHHLEHWAVGGSTNLDNMILLCGFHHRSYHDGGYRIARVAGGVSFETDDGHLIGQQVHAPVDLQMTFHPDTARAEWGGGRIDHDHLMFGLTQYLPTPEARASPPN